eukprot:1551660-Rhodomonas_salina.2
MSPQPTQTPSSPSSSSLPSSSSSSSARSQTCADSKLCAVLAAGLPQGVSVESNIRAAWRQVSLPPPRP